MSGSCMSIAEDIETSSLLKCPACGGEMPAMETICTDCRARLVAHVMGVTAADYPVPARALRKSEIVHEPEGIPSPSPLDIPVSNNSDDDEYDLAPVEALERLGSSGATKCFDESRAPQPTVAAPAPEIETRAKALRATHTLRNIFIVLGALLLAGLLAAGVWSYVIPSSAVSGSQSSRSVQ